MTHLHIPEMADTYEEKRTNYEKYLNEAQRKKRRKE